MSVGKKYRYWMWVASVMGEVHWVQEDLRTKNQVCYDENGILIPGRGGWSVGLTSNWVEVSRTYFHNALRRARRRNERKTN